MIQPHGRNLRQIYSEALDIDDGPEREEFVRQQCAGDAELFDQVQKLLGASSKRDDSLEAAFGMLQGVTGQYRGSLPEEVAAQLPEFERGTQIGNYEIVEPVGAGGMAVVFRANQLEPIQRQVALKLLKPGMDSSELLARFKLEQDALARMEHPNVATVFDAGLTDRGRPYFAMELVDGLAVDQYCGSHRVNLSDRLALFQSICRAVHHAHEKSIVHRDLKPSNLLVTEVDGAPIVKVIDFGIAKAMEVPLEQTKFTDFAQLLGTPLYMSPEMVAFEPGEIDRRSDVYALGAVLCQMLTGSPPIDSETMRSAGFDGMRHLIRNVAPRRPSLRGSVAPGLAAPIPKVLDWVVLKALEKSPDDRYQTAADLADDVQRFLSHQPTVAAPPSIPGRLHKLVRRHPAITTIACLSVLFACFGTWMFFDKLDLDRKRQKAEKEALRLVEQRQQEIADQRRREVAAADTAEANALQQMIIALNDFDLSAMATIQLPRNNTGSLLGHGAGDASDYSFRQILLDLASPKPVRTFSHPAGVNDSCFSRDGQSLITVAEDGKVRLWNLRSGELVKTIGEHIVTVQAVAISPDGSRVVSGDKEGFVKVWDLASNTELFSYGPCDAGVESIAWSPDGELIAVAHRYEFVRLLDPELNLQHEIRQDEPRYIQIAFSPDSKQIGSASEMYTECWDTTTFEIAARPLVAPMPAKIEGLCWLAGNARRVLISNSMLPDFHMVNLDNGEVHRVGSSRQLRCQGLASSPDGRYVVGGFDGGKIEVYEVAGDGESLALKLSAFFAAHSTDGSLRDLLFIDNKHFVSSAQDGDVHLWNIDNVLPFSVASISSDKQLAYCSCDDESGIAWIQRDSEQHTADVLYFDGGPQVASFKLPEGVLSSGSIQAVETAFCRREMLLAVSTSDAINVVDQSLSCTKLSSASVWPGNQQCAAVYWHEGGSSLAAAIDKKLSIWTFPGDDRKPTLEGSWDFRRRGRLQFNEDRGTLYCPDYNRSSEIDVVRELSLSGEIIREWPVNGLMTIGLDASNQLLAIACTGGFTLIDTSTNDEILTPQNAPSTQAVQISDDGRILIAVHERTRFSVWHIPTGKRLGQIDPSKFCHTLGGELSHVNTRHFAVVERSKDAYRLATIRTRHNDSPYALRNSPLLMQPPSGN